MNLPEQFIQQMSLILKDQAENFLCSLDSVPNHSIRINTSKWQSVPSLEPVVHAENGYFLRERPLYTLDPLFHAGVYYAQESSSMFLEQLVKALPLSSDSRVLDLCASPGGKSTHLISLLPESSLLVSNEVIGSRAQVLSENLKKWGYHNVVVTNNDPRDFNRLASWFDLIVVDAPCSGEGLFRRDEHAVEEWSMANRTLCSQRQRRIVADVWGSLREGGYLIYSTCTYNPGENEENLQWLTEEMEITDYQPDVSIPPGVVVSEVKGLKAYRFYPHLTKGEGFFITVVQKGGDYQAERPGKMKDPFTQITKSERDLVNSRLNKSCEIIKWEDTFLALPTQRLTDLIQLKSALRLVHAGVKVGEIKKGDLLPAHELSLSQIINNGSYPSIELTIEQALRFLKKDDLFLPGNEMGWNRVTYRDVNLGWIKNIGTRFNNSFPREWRIRMTITDYTGQKLEEEIRKFPL